jgi:hypothetical protein
MKKGLEPFQAPALDVGADRGPKTGDLLCGIKQPAWP